MRRYDPERADRLLAASLARFEQQGMSIAAADTMLMASQLAYGRGDIAEMQRLGERARAVYEAQGVYDRCAQLDFLVAASIEDSLNRSDQDQPAAYAIDAATCRRIWHTALSYQPLGFLKNNHGVAYLDGRLFRVNGGVRAYALDANSRRVSAICGKNASTNVESETHDPSRNSVSSSVRFQRCSPSRIARLSS